MTYRRFAPSVVALTSIAFLASGCARSDTASTPDVTIVGQPGDTHETENYDIGPPSETLQDWRNFADWVGVVEIGDVTAAPTGTAREYGSVQRMATLTLKETVFARFDPPPTLSIATSTWILVPDKKPQATNGSPPLESGGTYLVALTQHPTPKGGPDGFDELGDPEWILLGPDATAPVSDDRIASASASTAALRSAESESVESFTIRFGQVQPDPKVERYADQPGVTRFFKAILEDLPPQPEVPLDEAERKGG